MHMVDSMNTLNRIQKHFNKTERLHTDDLDEIEKIGNREVLPVTVDCP